MSIPAMTLVQYFSMGTSAVLIFLCLWVMHIRHEKFYEYLPWLIWFIHTLVFYSALLMRWEVMAGSYGAWGQILRLHGYLTISYHFIYKALQHYAVR